jgi:DNA-binding protein HU-beta
MSKTFIAATIQKSSGLTGVASERAAAAVVDALVKELKKTGKFTLPSFGTFIVRKTKARTAVNPMTRVPVKVKAAKTVKFKVSPTLRKLV